MWRLFVCLLVVSVAPIGCSSRPDVTEPPPPPEPPKVAPVEKPTATALTERVVFRYPDPAPAWAYGGVGAYPNRKAQALYFLGVGIPNDYEQKARSSARHNAAQEIAGYLNNSVKVAEYFSDELVNSKGYVPIQALVRKTVGKHVSEAVIRGQYEVATYIERIERMESRVPQLFFKVKAVYEYPTKALRDAVEQAKKDFEEQAKALDIEERDEVKKQLIDRSVKMLDAMAAQDFSAPGK